MQRKVPITAPGRGSLLSASAPFGGAGPDFVPRVHGPDRKHDGGGDILCLPKDAADGTYGHISTFICWALVVHTTWACFASRLGGAPSKQAQLHARLCIVTGSEKRRMPEDASI